MTSIPVNFVALMLVFVLFSSISAQLNISDIPDAIPDHTTNLKVFVLPVGQGDCNFIQCPTGRIFVFDCGSSGSKGKRLEANQIKNWIRKQFKNVVYIFISHSDNDHHNYLPVIFEEFVYIRAVYIGGILDDYKNTDTYYWLEDLQRYGRMHEINDGKKCINDCALNIGKSLCLSKNYQFNILAANVGPTTNEKSIVMKIAAPGGWSMLLSGDMEGDASVEIVNEIGTGLQSRVYQMSHHGASTKANIKEWIEAINPEYAFASSGYNYGICHHPRCDTIVRLFAYGDIGTTTVLHHYYCGMKYKKDKEDCISTVNILETSPTDDKICLLWYESIVDNNPTDIKSNGIYCKPIIPSQLAGDEAVYEDDCDDDFEIDEAEGGEALSMVAC